jgi:hypothetical protein
LERGNYFGSPLTLTLSHKGRAKKERGVCTPLKCPVEQKYLWGQNPPSVSPSFMKGGRREIEADGSSPFEKGR